MFKLRIERRKKGLTQAELASIVGVSSNYVSLIEKGKKIPSTKTINKMAKALEIPANALLEDELRIELANLAERYDLTAISNALKSLERQLRVR